MTQEITHRRRTPLLFLPIVWLRRLVTFVANLTGILIRWRQICRRSPERLGVEPDSSIASDEAAKLKTGALLKSLQKSVGDIGAVVDHSHGRCAFRISGIHARKVMAKNTAIDLHPLAFGPGQCALTAVAHMSALVIQVDDGPSYDLFVARSLARSFSHAIEHACHEFADE